MNLNEWATIAGLIASVVSILVGMVVTARYVVKKFDHWTETIIENSRALQTLTLRISRLEEKLK